VTLRYEPQHRENRTIWKIMDTPPFIATLAGGRIHRWFAVNIPIARPMRAGRLSELGRHEADHLRSHRTARGYSFVAVGADEVGARHTDREVGSAPLAPHTGAFRHREAARLCATLPKSHVTPPRQVIGGGPRLSFRTHPTLPDFAHASRGRRFPVRGVRSN